MQGLVSFAEPQHIKSIPGDVEVTNVSPGDEVLQCVSSEQEEQLLFPLVHLHQTGVQSPSGVCLTSQVPSRGNKALCVLKCHPPSNRSLLRFLIMFSLTFVCVVPS